MKKLLGVVIALAIIVGGFFAFNSYIYHEKQGDSQKALTHKDALYVVKGRLVKFENGIHTKDSITTRYFGNEVRTDLDLDGRDDIAFLITENAGGTTTSFYVVGALNKEDGYVGSQALFLGDNIAPQPTGKGKGKVIIVNYADTNSVGKSMWLLLDPVSMQWGEVVQDFEGEANPSQMSLGMKTWNWISTIFSETLTVVPKNFDDFGITFGTDDRFNASTDCNSMGGSYVVKGSTITFSNIFSTKKYCEGSQENDFSKTLSEVETYKFTSRGELIFTLKNGGKATFR